MTRAIDPFEEFLRKKKVEMLEQKYRHDGETGAEEEDAPPDDLVVDDDPEQEERIQEEMDEFFETGTSAGAEYFSKLESNISEDKVEEIKDALEEVFEEEIVDEPQTEEADEKFVEFFKQVQTEFDADGKPLQAQPASTAEELAAEVVQPDTEPSVAEVASPGHAEEAEAPEVTRLNLGEILSTPVADEEQLRQRVDLLCRLVAKVVERLDIPENEIIEVLIKSGVEF